MRAQRERQSLTEGRIAELKNKLGRAEIIDCTTVNCERAVFGTVVTLLDLDSDEEVTYQLLGPEEAKRGAGIHLSDVALGTGYTRE